MRGIEARKKKKQCRMSKFCLWQQKNDGDKDSHERDGRVSADVWR